MPSRMLAPRFRLLMVALAALAGVWGSASAQAPPTGEKRIALVIGNADYRIGRLANPVNDARAVVQALKRAGFGA